VEDAPPGGGGRADQGRAARAGDGPAVPAGRHRGNPGQGRTGRPDDGEKLAGLHVRSAAAGGDGGPEYRRPRGGGGPEPR
jgi:hypothetical protein